MFKNRKIASFILLVLCFGATPIAVSAAIAFDAATAAPYSVLGSLTYAHTVTGSNTILLVGVRGSTGDTVTGVTYAGTSMTLVDKGAPAGGRYTYLFYLLNPTTGTNNVVVSGGVADLLFSGATSYTGVAQTAPEASNKTIHEADSATDATGSVTTVSSNAWAAGYIATNDDYASTDAGTNLRATIATSPTNSPRTFMVDSGVVASPTTKTLGITIAADAANAWVSILVSLAPAVSASTPDFGSLFFFQ